MIGLIGRLVLHAPLYGLVVVLLSCSPAGEEGQAPESADGDVGLEEVGEGEEAVVDYEAENSESGFNVEALTEEPQLAIEVEVTANGVRPVGQPTIVRGPKRSDSSVQDLRVVASTQQGAVAEYTIEDPRFMEIEGSAVREATAARTFIHVPLDADLTQIDVIPLIEAASVQGFETVIGEDGKAREAEISKGGRFAASPLMVRACQGKTNVKECEQVLKIQ